MNCELKKLTEWLRSKKLSLNSGKSELVIFRSKTKKELDEITIKINKSKLSSVPTANYFDVVPGEFFSWDVHVNNLRRTLAQPNGILCILRHYVPQRLAFQYISPFLLIYFIRLLSMAIYFKNQLAWQFTSKTNLNSPFCKRNVYAQLRFLFTKITVILCLKILSYLNSEMFWNQRS